MNQATITAMIRPTLWKIVLIAMTLLACQKGSAPIKVSISKSKIHTSQQFRITTQLAKNGQSITAAAADFEYTSARGEIVDGIYRAPANAGQDTITVLHRPTKTRKQIVISVVQPPVLIVALGQDKINCNQHLELRPLLQTAGNKQPVSEACRYQAQRGSFSGNVYQAPASEGTDTLKISYPKLGLDQELIIQVQKKPVLVATIATTTISSGQSIPVTVYLQKSGQKVAVAAGEYRISCVKGRIAQGNIYQAPDSKGQDTITVMHPASQQRTTLTLMITAPVKLVVDLPKKELLCYERMTVNAKLFKGDSQSQDAVIEFQARRGKFVDNVYHAPKEPGQDMITVIAKASGQKQTFPIKIKYSKYRLINTERFSLEVPVQWRVQQSDLGFLAKQNLRQRNSPEIIATAFPGLDFLDTQTIKLFFQQQQQQSREMEEANEEEIQLNGVTATRVTFENFTGKGKKSWWVLAKKDGAAYILNISGPPASFDAKDGAPRHILASFRFKAVKHTHKAYVKMATAYKSIDHPMFSLNIPEDWDCKNIKNNLLIGISHAQVQGKNATLFIMSYQQGEVQNLDLSLILVLFRQETVKDPTMKDTGERDLKMKHGDAKLIEFEGGKEVTQRMWIVATKHKFTAYGILILAPLKIWQENSGFAEKIIQSFQPK